MKWATLSRCNYLTSSLIRHYYIEVSTPATNVFGTGRYALSVTYDNRSLVNPASLPPILRGPYDSLSAGDLAGLLSNVGDILFQNNLHRTSRSRPPIRCRASRVIRPTRSTSTVASLGPIFGVDVYQVQAPQSPAGQGDTLTVSLPQMPVNGILPVVNVYDANANPVSSQILLNGNGNYVIQASGLTPGETYYLRVTGRAGSRAVSRAIIRWPPASACRPRPSRTSSSGTLSASDLEDQYNLYVAQSQLFQFVLSNEASQASSGDQVSLQITDTTGAVVYSLVGPSARPSAAPASS